MHSIKLFFLSLIESWFCKDFYRKVWLELRGIGFAYVLFLGTLLTLPWGWTASHHFSTFCNDWAIPILKEVPAVNFTEGVLHTPKNQTYTIHNPKTGAILAVIDPTGHMSDYLDHGVPVVFGATGVIVRNDEHSLEFYAFPQTLSGTLPVSTLNHLAHMTVAYAGAILFAVLWAFSMLYMLLATWLMTFVTKIFARRHRVSIEFGKAMRLTAFALTPAWTLHYTAALIGPHTALAGCVVFTLLAVFYTWLAVISVQKSND